MILSGPAIQAAVERGHIEIDPFDPTRINPASYDLELGDEVAVYTPEEEMGPAWVYESAASSNHRIDSKLRQNCTTRKMSAFGLTIYPGRLYLMHTRERIHTRKYVPIIDGKSSIGRLGLLVHVTAGYGDPGFDGQYTLEVASIAHPVIVYPGMRFAQVRFHMMNALVGQSMLYEGNYRNEAARGPVRSASWRQFEPK